jgi:hypothetical protein
MTVVVAASKALLSQRDASGFNVYWDMLVGERKSGSGPIQEEKRAIGDHKALILLGIGVTAGFVPYGSYGWAAFTILSKDYASPIVVEVTKRLASDTDPLATEHWSMQQQTKTARSGQLPWMRLPAEKTLNSSMPCCCTFRTRNIP